MKIKEVKTEQFAGVHDLDVKLNDGLNVIYGPNETGKTTFVNLISEILFRPAKLSKKSDKDFYGMYFPAEGKNGIAGDFSNGEISLESNTHSSYTLKKEWSSSKSVTSSVRLKTPGGTLADQNRIDSEIENVLKYGAGVYRQLLLSSQNNTEDVLRSLIDDQTTGSGDEEVINGASKAFAESDGVSIDALQDAIEQKISDIEGKHWDFEQQKPQYKSGRWGSGLGEILQAYYDMEDQNDALDALKNKQDAVDDAELNYQNSLQNASDANKQYEDYKKYAAAVEIMQQREENRKRFTKQLDWEQQILKKWPALEEQLQDAVRLSKEIKDRKAVDAYDNAQTIQNGLDNLNIQLKRNGDPDIEDVRRLIDLESMLDQCRNRLQGLNILANVRMMNNHDIRIVSISSGKPIELKDGTLHITEAVRIEIPNVMEMELASGSIDIEEVQKQIHETEISINHILQKYNIHTSDELSEIYKKAQNIRKEIDDESYNLKRYLNDSTMEELKSAYEQIEKKPREIADINEELEQLGINNPERAAAVDQELIDNYKQNYGSLGKLRNSVDTIEAELKKLDAETDEQIPEEYRNIDDPEKFLKHLEDNKKLAEESKEDAIKSKTRVETDLDNFLGDRCAADLKDQYDAAKVKFDQLNEDLAHWKHIQQVFEEEKEKIASHPLEDLVKNFRDYLNLLTDGNIEADVNDPDKLNLSVYSRNNLMDYEKLSEGTKDTVSLAFRLAVLDHLFPDGGGVMVLDDPFTDMDEKRMHAACRLVKKATEKHQIVFLTCREDIAEELGGNRINWNASEH